MKKSIIYIFIIWWLWIAFLFFFYFNNNDLKKENNLYSDFLVRNITCDTSLDSKNVYRKWDDIEYNFILTTNNSKKVAVDTNELSKVIDIEKILKDDEQIDDLSDIKIDESANIKIIWKAKQNWDIKDEDNLVKIIKTEDLEQEVEKLIEEEIEEEKIENIKLKIDLEKKQINSNINNLIQIFWENLSQIKYINIWWVSLEPIKNNEEYFLSINKDTFDTWEYFVIIQTKSWDIITTDTQVSFEYNQSKVNISNITPENIKNDSDRYIVIKWNWFEKTISLQLSNNVVLRNTTFQIINDNVMSIKIPSWIEAWEYYINIMKPEWIYEITNKTFLITI